MKITEKELKKIINEELNKITNEGFLSDSPRDLLEEALKWIFQAATEEGVKKVAGPYMSKEILLNSILNNLKKLRVTGIQISSGQIRDLTPEEEEEWQKSQKGFLPDDNEPKKEK